MGLPHGEEIMIVGRTMWTQCTCVTDRRTDGRTELRSQRPCNAERRTVKSEFTYLTEFFGKIEKISPLFQRGNFETAITPVVYKRES